MALAPLLHKQCPGRFQGLACTKGCFQKVEELCEVWISSWYTDLQHYFSVFCFSQAALITSIPYLSLTKICSDGA